MFPYKIKFLECADNSEKPSIRKFIHSQFSNTSPVRLVEISLRRQYAGTEIQNLYCRVGYQSATGKNDVIFIQKIDSAWEVI